MATIELTANHHGVLNARLPECIGHYIRFSNGCQLSLEESGGMFEGADPYGKPWMCQAEHDYIARVIAWLDFWNEDRDERGQLIDVE